MEMLTALRQWFEGLWTTAGEAFCAGLAVGTAVTVMLFLVLWLLLRRRRRCPGIRIEGSGGNLIITIPAVREFVRRLVDQCPDAAMRQMDVRRRRDGYSFVVTVDAVPGADLVALQATVSARIRQEAGRRLGMEGALSSVDVTVFRYNATEHKLARRKHRSGGGDHAPSPDVPDGGESDDGEENLG